MFDEFESFSELESTSRLTFGLLTECMLEVCSKTLNIKNDYGTEGKFEYFLTTNSEEVRTLLLTLFV